MQASNLPAFVLAVYSGLKVRFVDPVARLMNSSFPQVWLLEGPEKEGEETLRVLLFGEPIPFNYFALSIFKNLPDPRPLGRTAFWRWNSLMLQHRADFFYGESTQFIAQYLAKRRGYCLPEYVDAMVPTAPPNFSRSSGQTWVKTRKTVQENGWTLRISREEEDFLRFYQEYYVPTAQRKFAGYRYVMPLSEMTILFRMGFLLQVCAGEQILASILTVERKKDIWLGYYGGLEELSGKPLEGLQSASYYFGTQYALERGRTEVNFASARPYFLDGIYQHKRRWKARFEYVPQSGRIYYFVPNLEKNSVRRFMNRCPFIGKYAQGLEGFFFYDPAVKERQNWIAFCQKNYLADGIRRAHYIPLDILDKSSKNETQWMPPAPLENISARIRIPTTLFPKRPPLTIWPVLTRSVLEGVRRVRSKGRSWEYQRFYSETPRMPVEQLRRLQREKLIAMLQHAQKTVPHYQSLLKGFDPSQFSWEWFRTLPLMNRQEISLRPGLYRTLARLPVQTRVSTSGTTSHPLLIWVDGESIEKREIVKWRGREWWGLQRGDRHAHLWGREKAARLRRRLLERWLENSVPFDGYHFTQGVSERCYQALRGGSFKYVYGFASVIAEVASDWLNRNWRLPEGCIEAVIITADMISDTQKQMIWRAFGCPVISEYGSTEFHEIAFQCPEGGWHLDIDRHVIEFINNSGQQARPEEPAHLIITDLDNLAMPLIRYPIGDMASYTQQSCRCGRTFPLMHQLWGRASAFLELPLGGKASSLAVSSLIEDAYIECGQPCLPWQVVQTSPEELEIILTNQVRSSSLEQVIDRQIRRLDPKFRTAYRYVETLPSTPSGKRTRIVSLPAAAPASLPL